MKRNIWDNLIGYLCIVWIFFIYLSNLIYGSEPSLINMFGVTLMWIYVMAKEAAHKVIEKLEKNRQ